MPYLTNDDLPISIRHHVPEHGHLPGSLQPRVAAICRRSATRGDRAPRRLGGGQESLCKIRY